MATDLKISELAGKTTVTTGALITGVDSSGANFKMTVEDFIQNVLGSTGSLASLGTGTDILSISGLINSIRVIAAGQGITVSIDPTQAIEIASALTSGSLGAKILDVDNDIVKSLIAGTGIGLAESAGSIVVTASGTTAPTDVIIINQESDFPTQDAGTITLEALIIHEIGASFSTAKRFICEQGSLITARNAKGPTLTYTGTSDMFTGADIDFTIDRMQISSPNASRTFNFSDTTGQRVISIKDITIFDTPRIGSVSGNAAIIAEQLGIRNADQGWDFAGTIVGILHKEIRCVSTSSSFIYANFGTAVVSSIQLESSFIIAPASALFLSGAANNANVPAGLIANVMSNSTSGGMGTISGVTVDDIRWNFDGNSDIPDTRPDALLSLTSNATETVISGAGTPVLAAGTWVIESVSQMSGTTGGRATFDLEKDARLPVDVSATLSMASGGSVQVKVYLALNGSVISAASGEGTASSSASTRISVPWQLLVSANDFVELFVSNEDSTVNVVVTDAILRVN